MRSTGCIDIRADSASGGPLQTKPFLYSGFIAVHVLRILLEQGYKVRGTVRSAEKGDWLVKKFPGGDFNYVRDSGIVTMSQNWI